MTETTKQTDEDDGDRYWESDEFEELVARSLIASFETKIEVIAPPPGRWGSLKKAYYAPNAHDIGAWRSVGPYFTPGDRLVVDGYYWHHIDGLPEIATFSYDGDFRKADKDKVSGYLEIFVARRHRGALPAGCRFMPATYAAIYRIVGFYPQPRGGVEGVGRYFALRHDGQVVSEFDPGPITKTVEAWGAATLQYYADRRFLWNVRAIEQNAHATFGVYEEQIKSLFYSRELPLTVTGRKRPILHWVKAHQRRMSEGYDIDIEKYLRGITAFEYQGTKFEIVSPQKRMKRAA